MIPSFGQLTGKESLAELIDMVAKLQKQVEYMMTGNLNSKNVREIGGYLVSDDSLMSKSGNVGISSTESAIDDVRIWAGSDQQGNAPFRVTKSGKMVATNGHFEGEIEASTVTGSMVQTNKPGTYPRAVMDNSKNLYGAYKDANNYVEMIATENNSLSPAFKFVANGRVAYVTYDSSKDQLQISTDGGGVFIGSQPGTPTITLELAANVTVPSFQFLKDKQSGDSLYTVLQTKANKASNTGSAGGHNHGIPSGAQFQAVDGTVYTWFPASDHSHSQN